MGKMRMSVLDTDLFDSIYIYFIWILPLYNGGNHCRGNSGCVLEAMYNAITKYNSE